jgi:hypothetical protein
MERYHFIQCTFCQAKTIQDKQILINSVCKNYRKLNTRYVSFCPFTIFEMQLDVFYHQRVKQFLWQFAFGKLLPYKSGTSVSLLPVWIIIIGKEKLILQHQSYTRYETIEIVLQILSRCYNIWDRICNTISSTICYLVPYLGAHYKMYLGQTPAFDWQLPQRHL